MCLFTFFSLPSIEPRAVFRLFPRHVRDTLPRHQFDMRSVQCASANRYSHDR